MNNKLLMAFVLASGMALAQTGSSTGSTDQNQSQPTTPSQQQTTTPPDQGNQSTATTAASGQETVLRGCLKQSGGNWVISQNGQDITLNGDSSMLKPQDGHQVEVHGTPSSDGALHVTLISMISDSCTGGGNPMSSTSPKTH